VLEDLIDSIRAAVRANDRATGDDTLTIEPVLNWGGFVNRSFRIDDGRRRFLKLANDAVISRGLEKWRELADLLAARYHAPRMLDWLDIPGTPFAGPLFEWIEGRTPTTLNAGLAARISAVIRTLHDDLELAARLGPASSLGRAYLHAYDDRFSEDLAFIALDPPPFITPDLLAWMQNEASSLAAQVQRSAAFDELARSPVHNDLWVNNILVDPGGQWFLLDWDGLALGDPLIDWVMLFGPTRNAPFAATEATIRNHVPLNAAGNERLAVYLQASQLDWVIDPLADWVQAAHEPEHGAQVRAANETVYNASRRAYLSRFSSRPSTD